MERMALIAGAVVGLAALAALGALLLAWRRRRPGAVSVPAARAAFSTQRQRLERLFLAVAGASGKPRGLRWTSCELGGDVELARDRASGELLALAPVTIGFEAVPGSDMEGLPAVGNLRSATAVFAWRDGAWTTAGRTVFNLDPPEAIQRFRAQYEPLENSDQAPPPR